MSNIDISHTFSLRPRRGTVESIRKYKSFIEEGEFVLVQKINPDNNEDKCFGGAIIIGDGIRSAEELPFFIKDCQIEVKELQAISNESKSELTELYQKYDSMKLIQYNIDSKLKILIGTNAFFMLTTLILLITYFI